MSRLLPRLIAATLASLAVLGAAPIAASSSPETPWQAKQEFNFDWELQPPPGQPFEGAYRIYDSGGTLVRGETRSLNDLLKAISVPAVPGLYTLEAWLQNQAGEHGPHFTTTLRFDNAVPSPPALQPPPGWLLGTEPVALEIGPYPGPPPLSGIRGYAISLDRGDGSPPCVIAIRCSVAEIDHPGSGGGSIALGTLPEGVNFVRVVAVSGSGVASPVQTAEVRVDGTPPLVSLQGAPGGWSDRPVQLKAVATDELSGMTAAGPLGPSTAIAVDGAAAARAQGNTVTTTVTGSGLHRVEYFARDAAGNGGGAPQPATATIRIDEDPPTVAFAAAQDPADPERIEATVGDALSGPSPDRGWIALRAAGTHSRFEPLPTRVEGGRLTARWDSDSYPAGKYEFLATAFDAAGNAGTSTSRVRGGRMVLVNPLKLSAYLEAGFVGKRLITATAKRARFGRRVQFGGRLWTAAGAPAAGLEVAVTESFAAGAEPQERTTFVRTRADGRFGVRLAPGPSREVVASFAGTRTLTRASSGTARLAVPASVRLRASATSARVGGAPVVFSGRVAARGAKAGAATGLAVELQFRFRGGAWSEFRTVETDARGRFRYAYRFSDDDSRGVRFQFRAHVKGREGWPYEPSASRPVIVTGR
jgi:5-hydroxyisourate hydrolase-like protein (transthyretin family)